MATWADLERQAPEIAAAGRKLLYQFGPGLVFLATVRPDGGPRLHPVCANVVDGELCLLVIDSPKRRDLLRDGRFAVHTFPPEQADDEFYLTGRAVHRDDAAFVERVVATQHATGATTAGDEMLFTLDLERALYGRYAPRGTPDDFPPEYLRWRAR
jgi:hypothetical protein